MKFLTFIFIILISVFVNSKLISGQNNIDDAENYFFELDYKKASGLYLEIFQDVKSLKDDRALAGRKLAYFSWHFSENLEKAREYLQKSLEFEAYESYIYQDFIKYEAEAKNFDKAKEIYKKAISQLESDKKLRRIYTAYAAVVFDEAVEKLLQNQELDISLLEDALRQIVKVNEEEPGILGSAKIQLGLSLLLKDGEKAQQAWSLYYHIPDGQKASGLLTLPQKELFEIFTNWNKNELNQSARNKLILNLAASRFYQFAYLMKKYLPNNLSAENPVIADICNYYEFCEQIEDCAYKYYKDKAVLGENNNSQFKKEADKIQRQLWDKLNWQEKKPKYSRNKFINEVYNRFGTKFYIGEFYGSNFYIGGHTIIDNVRSVNQYGRTAEIQFSVLDQRFSNNYWGWFTGYMGFAGYADGSIIVKYREPSSSQPIIYWNKLTDKDQLNAWQESIAKLSIKDDSLVLHNPDADLLGIHNRIRLNIYSDIIDSLKAKGIEKDELRIHFISTFNEIVSKSNFDHEGRHAIDHNVLSKIELTNDTELEYRAKLSQIYFSKYPLLEVRFNIDNTPHGLANKKILEVISEWMNENSDKVTGFNENRPALPQLDLLTNSQLKEIIRLVEPFLN